jgi:hypothetical protein
MVYNEMRHEVAKRNHFWSPALATHVLHVTGWSLPPVIPPLAAPPPVMTPLAAPPPVTPPLAALPPVKPPLITCPRHPCALRKSPAIPEAWTSVTPPVHSSTSHLDLSRFCLLKPFITPCIPHRVLTSSRRVDERAPLFVTCPRHPCAPRNSPDMRG